MTGANASTPASEFGRSWTCSSSMPSAAKRCSSVAMASGVPRISRSSAGASSALPGPDQHLHRARDGARIAPDGTTRGVQVSQQPRHLVDRAQSTVPVIGQLGGQTQHPRPGRADHHRQARRPRPAWGEPGRAPDAPARRAWLAPRAASRSRCATRPRIDRSAGRWARRRSRTRARSSRHRGPGSSRPPLTSSSVSAFFASSAGLRKGMAQRTCPVDPCGRGGQRASSVIDSQAPLHSPSGSPNPT